MLNILICNNGLSAAKFIFSIRDWAATTGQGVRFIGICGQADLDAKYKYLDQIQRVFFYDGEGIPYTNMAYVVGVAEQCAKDYVGEEFMVWPGWGFLSEDDRFVAELERRNITFVGPDSTTIRILGDKIEATKLTERLRLNVPKTTTVEFDADGLVANDAALRVFAEDVGYPVLVKYSGGGGGRGQRAAYAAKDLAGAIDDVSVEVASGMCRSVRGEVLRDKVFVMKYLPDCFHLEVQFICDGEHFAHMLGRDCSVQRRKQKLIEEAPIPGITDDAMNQMIDDTRRIVLNDVCKYRGVGTAEFLLDRTTGKTYFLEINPRLQVEHIISEHLFDANLPSIQVQLARRRRLADIDLGHRAPRRHVVAARINSENVFKDFQASVGRVGNVSFNAYTHGYFSINNDALISSQSDGQIGHIFAVGPTRDVAIARLAHSLQDLVVDGHIFNTTQLLRHIIQHADFRGRNYNTVWLEKLACGPGLLDQLLPHDRLHPALCAVYRARKLHEARKQRRASLLRRGHQVPPARSTLRVDELSILYRDVAYSFQATCLSADGAQVVLMQNGERYLFRTQESGADIFVFFDDDRHAQIYRTRVIQDDDMGVRMEINRTTAWFPVEVDRRKIVSEFTGKMMRSVDDGQRVKEGDVVCRVEVMKMLTDVVSQVSGTVRFRAEEGTVHTGTLIADIVAGADDGMDLNQRATFRGRLLTRSGSSSERLDQLCPRDLLNSCEAAQAQAREPLPQVASRPGSLSKEEKVAQVYGSTYVYTLARMLAGNGPDAHCTELVLRDGELVPTDRPAGQNDVGMVGWDVRRDGIRFLVVGNDITTNYGSYSVVEDAVFSAMCALARDEGVPLVNLSCNSGANLSLRQALLGDIRMDRDDAGEWMMYLTEAGYAKHRDHVGVVRVVRNEGKGQDDEVRYVLSWVRNDTTAAATLNGSGDIAAETVRTYRETMVLTYVTGRSVGIGAYVARMGGRIIQKRGSPLLLTGHKALNDLLGDTLYLSDDQLGGTDVMHRNGVTDLVVDTDADGVARILEWLSFRGRGSPTTPSPTRRVLPQAPELTRSRTLLGLLADEGSFMETLGEWGKSVVTGRCRVHGRAVGLVMGESETTQRVTPADPGDPESSRTTVAHSGLVMFPDSSHKIARTIRDVRLEGLPLLVVANWRGFSGGTRDMFDEVLTFGSQIVEELVSFDQPVTVWIPPFAQLRGGAFVVWSPAINPRCMRMYMASTARVGVLEPAALKNVKIRPRRAYGDDPTPLGQRLAHVNPVDRDRLLVHFCDLHDRADANAIPVQELDDLRATVAQATL